MTNTITDISTAVVHDMVLMAPACGGGRGVELEVGTQEVTCSTCLARRWRIRKTANLYATLASDVLEARRIAEEKVKTVMINQGHADGARVRSANERIALLDAELDARRTA